MAPPRRREEVERENFLQAFESNYQLYEEKCIRLHDRT